MPSYDFKCHECQKVKTDVFLPITHSQDDIPVCCYKTMRYYITQAPMVHWKDYEFKNGGFIAHGVEGRPVITTQRQRKEMMERNNLIDGNDFGRPPTNEEQFAEVERMKASVDEITPTKDQIDRLVYDGHGDILEPPKPL